MSLVKFCNEINTLITFALLTYSVEHSPSWEANSFSTSQDIPCILWNPNVHYPIYKNQLSVHVMS
jgi:hypothetical protein